MKRKLFLSILTIVGIAMTLQAAGGSFGGGNGTDSNPYIIEDASDLNNVRNALSAHYQLADNIDLSGFGDFTRIGNGQSTAFTGSFDGNGYFITGLSIDGGSNDNVGLFGFAGNGSANVVIKNLGIIIAGGKSVKGRDNVGAIVGRANKVSFVQCFVSGTVQATGKQAGMILGQNDGAGTEVSMTNCYAVGEVNGTDGTGGLWGRAANSTNNIIDNCYAVVDVKGGSGSAGGILGSAVNSATGITITNSVVASKSVAGSYAAGQIVGFNTNTTTSSASNNFSFNGITVTGGTGYRPVNGTPKTKEVLKSQTTYENDLVWNFTSPGGVWVMGNNGYALPVLQALDLTLQPTVTPVHLQAVAVITTSAIGCTINLDPLLSTNPLVGSTMKVTVTPNSAFSYFAFTVNGVEKTLTDKLNGSYEFSYTLEENNEISAIYISNSLSFSGTGTGKSGDPYVIISATQLNEVRNNLYAHYQLGNDINVSAYQSGEGWEPIGNETTPFRGSFDGNNYTVIGLYINRPSETGIGLFGVVNGTASEIKNLGLTTALTGITGKQHVGGLVGYVQKGSLAINECFVVADVDAVGVAKDTRAGGIVGMSAGNLTINNCYVTGSVKSNYDGTGGILGCTWGNGFLNTSIKNSYAANSVAGVTTSDCSVGGLVGVAGSSTNADANNNATLIIQNCVAINGELIGRGTNVLRILGYSNRLATKTLSDNYAFSGMLVKGSTVNGTNANNETGLNQTEEELRTQSTYKTNLSWDFDNIWKMGNAQYPLPVLKNRPSTYQPATMPSYFTMGSVGTFYWLGYTNAWNTSSNWSGGQVPGASDQAMIDPTYSGFDTYFPNLLETDNAVCNTITLEAGAKLGNQHLLTYSEATVNYALEANRWNMISTPIAASVEDFYREKEPSTWIQGFGPAYGSNQQWNYINDLNHTFDIGDGFVFYYKNDFPLSTPFSLTGRMAGSFVEKTLNWGNDGSADFALVGNPFMTTIGFDKLYETNVSKIEDSYLVYTADGYAGYNLSEGAYGIVLVDELDQFIAPLQGFIVEKAGNGDLVFDAEEGVQATNAPATLRNSVAKTDRLSIVASNPAASVRTIIAQDETRNHSHKLFNCLSATPDIYTKNGNTAYGVQLLQTNDALIPLGLRTNYAGEMSFIFTGMDSYDAQITFSDVLTGENVDLTDLATYTYELNYTPASNNEENRFFIVLAPKTPNSIGTVSDGLIRQRYYNLQGLEIACPLEQGVYLVKNLFESGRTNVVKVIR